MLKVLTPRAAEALVNELYVVGVKGAITQITHGIQADKASGEAAPLLWEDSTGTAQSLFAHSGMPVFMV